MNVSPIHVYLTADRAQLGVKHAKQLQVTIMKQVYLVTIIKVYHGKFEAVKRKI